MSNKEAKEKFFKRVYDEAPLIECECGCGELIKSKDMYGRDKRFVSGHNNRKYDDPTQYKREWNHRNRESRRLWKKKSIRDKKIFLVTESGGKCIYCEYEFDGTNECAFDFHHTDPSKKEMSLNKATLDKCGWNRILEEFAKCEIVCARCHRLIHNEYKEEELCKSMI